MLTVKEALAEQGYYHPWRVLFPNLQAEKNELLRIDLEAKEGDGWPFFYVLCDRELSGGKAPWHPDRVAEVAEKYAGYPTLEALEAWLALMGEAGGKNFLELLEPKLILDPAPVAYSQSQITDFLYSNEHLKMADIEIMDAVYQVPNGTEQCYEILKKSPSHRFKHLADRRDCDKFVTILTGWLAEQALGNLTAKTCIFKGYNADDELVQHHAVILFIYREEDGTLAACLGEPQSEDWIWGLDEAEPGHSDVVRCVYTDLFI
jgi:hypothetical protein